MANGLTLKIDTATLQRAMHRGTDEVLTTLRQSVGDVLDGWKAAAFNLALKDKSTLRRGISTEQLDGLTGEIKSVAIEESGKWGAFNYAYYWHEERKDSPPKHVSTPGTVPNYLDKAAEDNQAKWEFLIQRDLEKCISKIGR